VIKGYKIPKGMNVTLPYFALHRDPDLWPDPLTFNPERYFHTDMQSYRQTSIQSCNHTTIHVQPCSHAVMQPYSHTAMQPYSHATIQQVSHAAMQPCSHAAIQSYSHRTGVSFFDFHTIIKCDRGSVCTRVSKQMYYLLDTCLIRLTSRGCIKEHCVVSALVIFNSESEKRQQAHVISSSFILSMFRFRQ
jgi:hypothetical protein